MRSLFLFLVFLSVIPVAAAQIPAAAVETFQTPPDPHWSSIATGDVRAAYRLLKDNHPGAASEMHDEAFVHRMNAAYALALQRAAKVDSYQGYLATLAGFATAMGDKHVWSRPTFVVNLPRWPEFLVSKQGDHWVVTDTEPSQSGMKGAALLSCDGEAVAELARKNLGGFRAVWSVGAQQIQSAPWLLVDEGNPFVKRPSSCVFEQAGRQSTVTLHWVRIKRENLLPRLKSAGGAGAAGFGVRQVGDGYWIALQDLVSDKALRVVQAVQQQESSLREARFVVLDLRGNGGGSSVMGREIAKALMGEAVVTARLGSPETDCSSMETYRATPDNLIQLEYVQKQPFVAEGGAEVRDLVADEIRRVRAALAAGHQFSGEPRCMTQPKQSDTPPSEPPSLLHGKLILLTDNACFSSCLAVTDDFRTLGAFHVGQTTDAATHFVDVREQYLPSGYSLFSTLQAVSGYTYQVGPFDPTLTYDGDIADTAALENWITQTVAR